MKANSCSQSCLRQFVLYLCLIGCIATERTVLHRGTLFYFLEAFTSLASFNLKRVVGWSPQFCFVLSNKCNWSQVTAISVTVSHHSQGLDASNHNKAASITGALDVPSANFLLMCFCLSSAYFLRMSRSTFFVTSAAVLQPNC